MSDTDKVMEMIKEHDVKYVDFRFTDPRGKWQHLAHHVRTISEDFLNEGVMFDGSSIAGWKAINECDMMLVPDCSTAVLDPFAAQTSLIIFCDVHEPLTGQPYARDPRSTAKKAEQYLIVDRHRRHRLFRARGRVLHLRRCPLCDRHERGDVRDRQRGGPYVSSKKFPDGNTGHRPPIKGGYFPVPPVDSQTDLRAEMLSVMADMGLKVEKHHHEVAPSQAELGFEFSTLVRPPTTCRSTNTSCTTSPSSTARPRPSCPSRSWATTARACMSTSRCGRTSTPCSPAISTPICRETALYYIGGIIRHAKAINAFTNPTTNSYKRLIPGFEAPVLLAYSSRNRSASCRIPFVSSPKAKRVEVRYPDPAANPYLGFAAMLMAGLDGIQNKIHPGDPIDKNLYDLPPEELKDIPIVCGSLREALGELAPTTPSC